MVGFKKYLVAAAAMGALAFGSTASAAVFVVNGTVPGGPNVSAEAIVTAGAGTLSIDVNNTIANFSRSAQAIRGIELDFEVDPTSFLTFTADGQLANISTNLNPDVATPIAGEPDRWAATLGGGTLLIDIGGTQPAQMISGNIPIGNANTGVGNFNPYLLGSGFFDLTFAPNFTPNVTSITFRFGTGPELTLNTPCDRDCDGGGGGNEIPEPGTWALMILGFGAAGSMLRRRRRAFA